MMSSKGGSNGGPTEAVISNNRKAKMTARSTAEVKRTTGDAQFILYVILESKDPFQDCQSFSRGSSHDPIAALLENAEQAGCIQITAGMLFHAEGPEAEVSFGEVVHSIAPNYYEILTLPSSYVSNQKKQHEQTKI